MNFSRLADMIDHLEEIYGIPNCDISIYREHEEIFRRSSGFADLARTRRTSDQDLYWLYSASKVSLSMMVMQLAEQGLLRLEDPVSKYIPELCDLQVREGEELVPCGHQATIEDFLAMQGGLDYDIERADVREFVKNRPGASTREIIRQWLTRPLVYQPGTRFLYSMCHDVLGAVIEVVTGKRLSDHIREAIAAPLGMQDLDYGLKEEKKHRMVQQYRFDLTANEIVGKEQYEPVSPFENPYVLGKTMTVRAPD